MNDRKIPIEFVRNAANILGETDSGLSGPQIVEITNSYAAKYNISIPYSSYPFDVQNKRTALAENLLAFDGSNLFEIISSMCKRLNSAKSQKLLLDLIKQYGSLNKESSPDGVDVELIKQTQHWLSKYPDVLKIFNSAIEKQTHKLYDRNILDDLRLSLELLLKKILNNSKSLEKQLPDVGELMKNKGSSKEFTNMLHKLLDYYTKYQNDHVKHADDDVEIEFIFELTASFMRYFIRLSAK